MIVITSTHDATRHDWTFCLVEATLLELVVKSRQVSAPVTAPVTALVPQSHSQSQTQLSFMATPRPVTGLQSTLHDSLFIHAVCKCCDDQQVINCIGKKSSGNTELSSPARNETNTELTRGACRSCTAFGIPDVDPCGCDVDVDVDVDVDCCGSTLRG